MKPLEVLGIRIELPGNQPVLLLREQDGARVLPVWIGAAEASAIAGAMQGVVPPRPLTHDLLLLVVEALGQSLTGVTIDSVTDHVYYATLEFAGGQTVSARTSDAIALAVRCGAPVTTSAALLDECGITMDDDAEQEDEVEAFRAFLEDINPEDFEGPQAPGDQASGDQALGDQAAGEQSLGEPGPGEPGPEAPPPPRTE